MEDWGRWLSVVLVDSVGGLAKSVLLLAAIIIPLSIVIEFLRAGRSLDTFARWAQPFVRWLGLSGKAAFPLMAGLVFGLAYGAGVILQSVREDGLSPRDLRLLCIFLVGCHAVIEDTLLFVPFGVNPVALLGTRFLLAVVMTVAAARVMDWTERRRARGRKMVG